MRQSLEGRVRLVQQLLANGPEVDYADLMLILTAVLSACATVRWPSRKGERIDKKRFVELLVSTSSSDARAGYISVPALLSSGLISEAQTPWSALGKSSRIYKGEEIDCDLNSAVIAFPMISKKELKRHSYGCLIYAWSRCGYAHEYCASDRVTTVPPSREKAQVSYIGRRVGGSIVRMPHFHVEYLIDLADQHAKTLPNRPSARPKQWWLDLP
jgi:hypothetical protein